MFIVVGNGHYEPRSNPGWAHLHFTITNAFGKIMNAPILSKAKGK